MKTDVPVTILMMGGGCPEGRRTSIPSYSPYNTLYHCNLVVYNTLYHCSPVVYNILYYCSPVVYISCIIVVRLCVYLVSL